MNVYKVDEAKRIRLPRLRPGDFYEPRYTSLEEIVLHRVPGPRGKEPTTMTRAQVIRALQRSSLTFLRDWEEIRNDTREP